MNATPLKSPLDAALALAHALDADNIPYAIGGALAFGIWAVPRATMDVDLNVFVEQDEHSRVFHVLESLGVELDHERASVEIQQNGMFECYWDSIRLDIFTPSIEFSWEAQRTLRHHMIEGQKVAFLSPEALAVFKLLFFRSKDIVDLERLIGVQGPALNKAYIRRQVLEMMGPEDPRIQEWDRLCNLEH